MLELHYCNDQVLVYDASDWAILRKSHRILGSLIGNTYMVQTLPLKLLPEEVLLLIDKQVANVVERNFNVTPAVTQKFEQFEADLHAEQQIIYKNNRKRQLESMIDNIVAAKRKRGDERTADEILNDELEKSCKITKENMIFPILLRPIESDDSIEVSRDLILKKTSNLKYQIYKDLWGRGYFITSGHKFGADFLVYLGDPIAYHAIFIVHCVEDRDRAIHSTEIVAFGRLATSVKKRAILAYFNESKISYITINWIDS